MVKSGYSGRTQIVALQKNKYVYHGKFRTAIQERQGISAAGPSAPLDIEKPSWRQQHQSQQQQGSRVRLQTNLESETAGRNPTQDDVWHSWWNQIQWNDWSAWNQDQWRES